MTTLASEIYYFFLAKHSSPDVDYLSRRMRATEANVRDALDWLIEAGFIGRSFEMKGYSYKRDEQRNLEKKHDQISLGLDLDELVTDASRHPMEGKS